MLTITIEGNTIKGFDADGKEVFSHSYTYVDEEPLIIDGETMEGMSLHIYKADAEGDSFARRNTKHEKKYLGSLCTDL